MSFICAICRDLLKITEECSPRHPQYLSNTGLANHQHPQHASPGALSSSNNVSGGRRKEKNNSIVATKCGHLFHYPCLSVWLSQSVNLTTDSKMRCPSCKQLIYIYELVQLFPVENNGCSEHVFPAPFQQKMKCMMEQLENLVRDLGKNLNNNGSPIKGAETPTRLQRIRDSPKKLHASQQWAEIINDFNLLRGSITELNSIIDQHAELGSVVERQNKELSELRSRNAELLLENEELKLRNEVVTVTTMVNIANSTMPMIDTIKMEGIQDDNENAATTLQKSSSQTDSDSGIMDDAKDAQVSDDSLEIPLVPPQPTKDSVQGEGPKNSPLKDKERRPSVRFLEPFDEFDEVSVNNGSIPIDKKDLRLGDKVIWYFEGNPEVGTVKWKGFIGSQINVGVEFERQLGLPIKDLDAIQYIFKSKPGHGRLIPVNELISYDKGLFSDKHLNLNSTPTAAYECVHSESKHNGGPSGLKRIQVCAHQ